MLGLKILGTGILAVVAGFVMVALTMSVDTKRLPMPFMLSILVLVMGGTLAAIVGAVMALWSF